MDDRPLEGRRALVTGAGRGLGRATALALADAGAALALAGRSMRVLAELATELESHRARAVAVAADVTVEADVERMVAEATEALGGLDILVNNSGVLITTPLAETSLEDWQRVIATNLTGNFLCCRAAAPYLFDSDHAKVINVASIFGFHGEPSLTAYSASKAAVINLTRTLAAEWARTGVQVNAIAPGYFETEMNADARADAAMRERIVRQIPQRRMGGANELGTLMVYLASSAADFVTGETIVIDGGQLAG